MSNKDFKAERKDAGSESATQKKLQEIRGLTRCAVTFESFGPEPPPVVTACGHSFSAKGLLGVVECPICRGDMGNKPANNFMLMDVLEKLDELEPILQADVEQLHHVQVELKKERQVKACSDREIQELKGQIKNLAKKRLATTELTAAKQPPEPRNLQQPAKSDEKRLQPAPLEGVSVSPNQEGKAVDRTGYYRLNRHTLLGAVLGGLGVWIMSRFQPASYGQQQLALDIPATPPLSLLDPSVAPLKPHVDLLLANSTKQTIPNIATLFGEVLSSEQRTQLIESLRQQERLDIAAQYMTSGDRELIPKGHEILNELIRKGYSRAQYRLGLYTIRGGSVINKVDLINQGIALIQKAANQGDQQAKYYLDSSGPPWIVMSMDEALDGVSINLEPRTLAVRFHKAIQAIKASYASETPEKERLQKESLEQIKYIAESENYAPAQLLYGWNLIEAGYYLNDLALIDKGISFLEKAAEQDLLRAKNILNQYPLFKKKTSKETEGQILDACNNKKHRQDADNIPAANGEIDEIKNSLSLSQPIYTTTENTYFFNKDRYQGGCTPQKHAEDLQQPANSLKGRKLAVGQADNLQQQGIFTSMNGNEKISAADDLSSDIAKKKGI